MVAGERLAPGLEQADEAAVGYRGCHQILQYVEDAETLDGIKAGTVEGTIVQNPYMYGFKSVEVLDALSKGDRSVLPKNGMIDIPARTITKGNVDAFRKDLNEKLGKSDS